MKVTKLINIGKSLEKLLTEIDVNTAEEFLEQDPVRMYKHLENNHPNLHLAVLASFIGARTNTPWYFIYHQVKKDYISSQGQKPGAEPQ